MTIRLTHCTAHIVELHREEIEKELKRRITVRDDWKSGTCDISWHCATTTEMEYVIDILSKHGKMDALELSGASNSVTA